MATSRRQFLTLASVGTAGAGLGLAGCSRGGGGTGTGGGGGEDGDASIVFTWWGNEIRNENTTNLVAAYTGANEGVSIEEQPGEWASYWDRLATQTAGNTAPDLIQMDMNYISEYGQRGALLDLAEYGLDTSAFVEGTADSGLIGGATYGVNAGINTPTIMLNQTLVEGLGVEIPDDMSWTWDDFLAFASAIAEASGGDTIGTGGFISNDALLGGWLRQQGLALFTEDGLGFEVSDIQAWLEYHLQFAEVPNAMPTASQMTEDASVPLDQSLFVTGGAAMGMFWSNQLGAVEAAAGQEMTILRYPSIDGDATTRQAWYKASMLWSASARTENPEAVVELINWLVNSEEAGAIELAERGIPANADVAAAVEPDLSETQQRVLAFINEIEPELGETPVAPPAGGGNQLGSLLSRYGNDMLFGNISAAEAAQGFHDELSASITA